MVVCMARPYCACECDLVLCLDEWVSCLVVCLQCVYAVAVLLVLEAVAPCKSDAFGSESSSKYDTQNLHTLFQLWRSLTRPNQVT